MDAVEQEYDNTPYPSFPLPQTHSAHAYTLGKCLVLMHRAPPARHSNNKCREGQTAK